MACKDQDQDQGKFDEKKMILYGHRGKGPKGNTERKLQSQSQPEDKVFIKTKLMCVFLGRKVDCNYAVVKFLSTSGRGVDLRHDKYPNGFFTACSRSTDKRNLGS